MNRIFIAVFAAVSLIFLLMAFVWFDTTNKTPNLMSDEAPVESKEETAKVLIVNRTLKTGAFVEENYLSWKKVSALETENLGTVFLHGVSEPKDLAGSIVYKTLEKGTILRPGMIVQPKESGYLATLLSPGKRAISLELDPMSGGFGQLRPGNFVDVLLTSQSEIEQDLNGQPVYNNIAVETVLQNVRLIAVGDHFSEHQKNRSERSAYDPLPVTFEVTLSQAETLLLSSKLGEISLVLRSFGDDVVETGDALKWAKDISGAHDMEQQPTQTVTVVRGGEG